MLGVFDSEINEEESRRLPTGPPMSEPGHKCPGGRHRGHHDGPCHPVFP